MKRKGEALLALPKSTPVGNLGFESGQRLVTRGRQSKLGPFLMVSMPRGIKDNFEGELSKLSQAFKTDDEAETG